MRGIYLNPRPLKPATKRHLSEPGTLSRINYPSGDIEYKQVAHFNIFPATPGTSALIYISSSFSSSLVI